AAIRDIYARVAEKFSPFNLNVTTIAPSTSVHSVNFTVVIGGDGAWDTADTEAGGVGIISSFVDPALPNKAFVFPSKLPFGDKAIAEAAAHEAGHGFGLTHQSTWSNGSKTAEYNPGTSDKAPLMGLSYNSTRGQWWRGPSSTKSSAIQDDLKILSSKT